MPVVLLVSATVHDIHGLALRWHGRDKTIIIVLEVSLVKLIDDRKIPLLVFIHLVKLNSLKFVH